MARSYRTTSQRVSGLSGAAASVSNASPKSATAATYCPVVRNSKSSHAPVSGRYSRTGRSAKVPAISTSFGGHATIALHHPSLTTLALARFTPGGPSL